MDPKVNVYSSFESEMRVRPDDLDVNAHVHYTRYLDYVLAARYDQMERCYLMPMSEFTKRGFGWVVRTAHAEFKRPLGMGDYFIVRTAIEEMRKDGVRVTFSIRRKDNNKVCCEGFIEYTMIDAVSGRSTSIPPDIVEKYSI